MSATGSERVTRTRAGPSKPAPKPKRKQVKGVEEDEESDDFTAMQVDSAEDEEIVEVEPPRKKANTARPANLPNGKAGAKGKGKAKADGAPAKKAASRAEVEVVDDDDEGGPTGTARAINDATSNNRATKRAGPISATKQVESLTRQLEAANARVQDLAKQLEESYRVRQTEPEELMQRQTERYDELIKAKDLLIKQQTEMLDAKEPLSREGKSSVLHMITREKADAEKHSSVEQIDFWKKQVDEKDRLIEERERQILDLKQIQSDLQYEIKMERESAQKASRNLPSAQRARGPNAVLGSDDPKHSELVSFYEDVTNLLVTDIKIQEPKYFNLDEWALTCIYTYADKTGSESSKRSLSFLLRFTHDPLEPNEPVRSVEDLDRAAQYTPLNLDKENPDFKAALQFLNTGFTFPRTQLPIFFSSLVENMKAACEGDQSESGSENGSADDVQLVE